MPTKPMFSKRKHFDVDYFKKFPGTFIIIQMVCCLLAFFLGVDASYSKSGPHVLFLLLMSIICFVSCFWIVIIFCEVKSSSLFRNLNWNKVGLIYSSVLCILCLVGSSCMIEVAHDARTLRAAGVFGFFGFTAFLTHFLWELKRFKETAMPPGAVMTASVQEGQGKETTPVSNGDVENSFDPVVEGTFKPLPTTNFSIVKDPEGQAESNYTVTLNKVSLDDEDSFDSDTDSDHDQSPTTYNFK